MNKTARISLVAVMAMGTMGAMAPARTQNLPGPECPRNLMENDDSWVARCRREQAISTQSKATTAGSQTRQELERLPALPAAKNPLLGRWHPQGDTRGKSGDVVGQLSGMLSNSSCTMMFGEGEIEFRPGTMVSIERGKEESLGTVAYRGGKNMVFVLPAQGVSLMPFEINGPNQVTFKAGAAPCALVRSGAAQPASPQGGTLSDKTAYRCPSGELLFVDSCAYGTPAEPACLTERYDLPKINGRVQMVMEKRSDLGKRVQSCEAGGFRYAADGSPVFTPNTR